MFATGPSVIIVSHGQPSDPQPAEDDLAALAGRVAGLLPDWQVDSATLAADGALEAALARAGDTPFIYPLFMTDGWFVRSALPKRLGGAAAHILPPLGAEPALPDLVADILLDELQERGWHAAQTNLLVASHGSGRSPKSKQATEAFVDRLRQRISFAHVTTGYVEEAPFFADVAMAAPSQAICLPFFAAYGGHVKEDITEALAAARFAGPFLDPIGTFDAVPALIADSLHRAAEGANQARGASAERDSG
ncbi:CbiX/SirB N-terminal domain-containing protein [Roseovarius sp. CAU 1744]|uniref:CbiX/SirB N-terminal domain-containing protein n=1 Tax=Roseovarius sp. CAU 1744 TaxID=3140368 RepID=UPI00325B2A73